MSKNKIKKIAEEKAFDYQREIGMIDSVSDDHVIARRMGFYDGFKAGAEWKEQQMLKDAVEASVNTYELTPGGSAYVEFVADMSAARFKLNDKVRIVVLKEKE